MTNRTPLLALNNVSVRMPSTEQTLIDALTWAIHPGERWAVVAPEGGGKTTLLRVMAGLRPPDTGEIYRNIPPLHADTGRAKGIAVLFCEPAIHFLAPVVWEEVLLTPMMRDIQDGPAQQRVVGALQLAGLTGDVATREIATLSHAQCTRVALAAVLAAHPPLLLADEPGARLSEEGENEMASRLAACTMPPHAMASVVFTSRMARARQFADRCLHLANGTITPLSTQP